MLDSLGSVVGLLLRARNGLWTEEFLQSPDRRTVSVSGTTASQNGVVSEYRSMTVAPTSVVCTIESVDGYSAGVLLHDPSWGAMLEHVREILTKYNVRSHERIGARFFGFGTNPSFGRDPVRAWRDLINRELANTVEESVGQVEDVGIALDAAIDDRTGVFFRSGPYVEAQENKRFERIVLPSDVPYNFICDADYFEKKFDLVLKPYKWCSVAVSRVEGMLAKLERIQFNR